ncbi:MAG: HlyD family secretion protein, partial [Nitrospira sp.]|nr:HlyD family secretion protein [Nitrospira sp.]
PEGRGISSQGCLFRRREDKDLKKILIAIGLIFLLITCYVVFSDKKGIESKPEVMPKTDTVKYVAAEGKVEAMPGLEVEVGSEIDGKIAEFFVEEGDHIKKGELIARLENRDIQAKLKEAEAELAVTKSRLKEVASGARDEEIKKSKAALEGAVADMDMAKKELERYERLFKESVITKSSMDDKERAFKVSAARVKEAEEEVRLLEKGPRQETLQFHEDAVKRAEAAVEYYKRILEKTFIIAPITGKVIRKYLQKGEMVSKDVQPYLIAIADVERIRINAEVDETDIGRIKIGDPVEVTSYAYSGEVFKGVVQEISDYAGIRKVKPNNPAKNLDMKIVQVKIYLKDKVPFRLGMTVDVRIMPGH